MAAKLAVPQPLYNPLRSFLSAEAIPLELAVGNQAPVRVVQGGPGQQSSTSVLQAGGWIACPTAFEVAATLGIRTHDLGKLLNHLDIKVRGCQLGCF